MKHENSRTWQAQFPLPRSLGNYWQTGLLIAFLLLASQVAFTQHWEQDFPKIRNGATGIYADLKVKNEGKVYYVVYNSQPPSNSAADVKAAALSNGGGAIVRKGSVELSGSDLEKRIREKGLSSNADYWLQIAFESKAGELSPQISQKKMRLFVRQGEYSYQSDPSKGDGKERGYLLYFPEEYYENPEQDFPMLIVLHGQGESGIKQYWKLRRHGPAKLIEQDWEFPFIVATPQAYYTWWNVSVVNEFYDRMVQSHRVDNQRVYMTGFSAGGMGTTTYVICYPEKIAACVPIYAGAGPFDACKMRNVPTWVVYNNRDFLAGGTERFIDTLKACNPTAPVKVTAFDSGGHDAWSKTYNKSGGIDIYAWMMQFNSDNGNGSNEILASDIQSASVNPDELSVGESRELSLVVQLDNPLAEGQQLVADFSSLDGSAETQLTQVSGAQYRIQKIISALEAGAKTVTVKLETEGQQTDVFTVSVQVKLTAKRQQELVFYPTDGKARGYLAYLPSSYSTSAENKSSLLIYLGSQEERGHLDYGKLLGVGPAKHIEEGHDFPMAVFSVQNYQYSGGWTRSVIGEFVDFALQNYNIAPDQVFLTGSKSAAVNAFLYALENPNKIRGVVPISTNWYVSDHNCAMSDVGVWFFHNRNDPSSSSSSIQGSVDQMNKCEREQPAKITIYEGSGRDAWTEAYRPKTTGDIYSWIAEFGNNGGSTMPTVDQISFSPESLMEGMAYDFQISLQVTDPDEMLSKVSTDLSAVGGASEAVFTKQSQEGMYTLNAQLQVNSGMEGTKVLVIKGYAESGNEVLSGTKSIVVESDVQIQFQASASALPGAVQVSTASSAPGDMYYIVSEQDLGELTSEQVKEKAENEEGMVSGSMPLDQGSQSFLLKGILGNRMVYVYATLESGGQLVSNDMVLKAQLQIPYRQSRESFQSDPSDGDGKLHGYLLYKPVEYIMDDSNKFPLMIVLGDMGTRGNLDYSKLLQRGPAKFIEEGMDLPMVVVSPQDYIYSGRWSHKFVKEFIEHLSSEMRIDKTRIYLTGYDKGAIGAVEFMFNNSDIVAAAAPVALNWIMPDHDCVLNETALWYFHNADDNISSSSRISDMVGHMNNSCEREDTVMLTLFPDQSHDAWTKAYDPSAHGMMLYNWLLSHSRDRVNNPNEVGVGYSANEVVPEYTNSFQFGTNLGYYPPWNDKHVASMAIGDPARGVDEGLGATSIRPALYESFLERWGYDGWLDIYRHYGDIGVQDITLFIGYPSDAHRDTSSYSPYGERSKMFANMYEPIWDNGENGTPVNENNYMANYVYKVAQMYGQYVKFWEIWNEPDFDYTGNAWRSKGMAGNWYDNDPQPYQLHNLKAPVEHYNRALRIAYEVIKSIDSTDYVCIGGIGYASFLDAVLRKTDNPVDGSVTEEYPLYGGAYFDCLSYHNYPFYALSKWTPNGFVYSRYSDAAVDEIFKFKGVMEGILGDHGYDGIRYPKKEVIITETNIPRYKKAGSSHIGSVEAQKNYVMKTYVRAPAEDISAIYIYGVADDTLNSESSQFQTMGLANHIERGTPLEFTPTEMGVGFKTVSDFLFGLKPDMDRTAQMNIPEGVYGLAYKDQGDEFIYVMWARTSVDESEEAQASYTFPASFNVGQLTVYDWEYSRTGQETTLSSGTVSLTGSPVFLRIQEGTATQQTASQDLVEFTIHPNPVVDQLEVSVASGLGQDFEIQIMDPLRVRVLKSVALRGVSAGTTKSVLINVNLSTGVYFVKVIDQKGQSSMKRFFVK
ncbi:MAG: hypothetical protein MI784_06520 [Cytophagales bacterium]|nr:hypothetical protein [Cytophagales bacterium]